ncbi:MAG: uridine phosphorylase [Sulfolobales archaeon]|nr:uridine phosphorylase [Sulfolobales archaeon]
MSAREPLTKEGLLYHIHLKPGDVPRYILLPGDPGRVPLIARFWDESRLVAEHRGFVTYVGRYRGVSLAATSTGIGGPSTAIVLEELLRAGADTFIRVGTTGALQNYIKLGDLIISSAAVRLDGTSKIYVDPEYPAVASYDVLLALVEAAETLGVRYHVGITASNDSFYVGQGRPGYRGYLPDRWRGIERKLGELNVLNFEMEASTIFTLSSIYGARAGTLCAAIANRVTDEFDPGAGLVDLVRVANEAVRILYEWDSLRESRKKKYLSMRLLLEAARESGERGP